MRVVQPIRDLDTLDKCFEIARQHDKNKRHDEVCWELILLVGFNTSLRVSDFRRFKVSDLRGKDYAQIDAKKTGKEARILINPQARREINRLLAGRKADEFIFQSRVSDQATHKKKPKTFGYHYYKMTGDVVSLQRILCHSYQRETLVYIGVIQENIDESLMKFNMLTGKRVGRA